MSDYDEFAGIDSDDGVDLTDTTPAVREVLKAGVYNAHIVDVEKGTSQVSGGQYWMLKMEVLDEPYVGAKLWDRRTLSWGGKGKPYSMQRLGLLVGEAVPQAKITLAMYRDRLIGLPVRVTVRVGEYNDQPNNEIMSVLPMGPSRSAASSSEEAPARARRTRGEPSLY